MPSHFRLHTIDVRMMLECNVCLCMRVYVSFVGVCVVCFFLVGLFLPSYYTHPGFFVSIFKGRKNVYVSALFMNIYNTACIDAPNIRITFWSSAAKKDSSWIAVYFYSCVAHSTEPTTYTLSGTIPVRYKWTNKYYLNIGHNLYLCTDTLIILENYVDVHVLVSNRFSLRLYCFGHKVILKNKKKKGNTPKYVLLENASNTNQRN